MTLRGHRILIPFLLTLLAVPAFAQQDERITRLEQKLDELLRQAEAIRQELQQLKGSTTTTTTETTDTTMDLTKVDIAPVENQPAPSAAKALNPDISVIGNFIGHAGDANDFEPRDAMALDEVEVAFQAFIDPYAKGMFFIAVTPDEVDVEEGYAQFVTLPWGLTAKAGKTKATFGKANTWHTHQRPWVDQPLMVTRFLGEEGVADTGVSVSKSIGNPLGAFVEATGEVYNDHVYNTHLKLFKDVSENSNVEVGTSWMRASDDSHLAGVDLTYRWKPLERSLYKSFIARVEGVANRRDDLDDTLYGFYASADYQLARRWHTGVRLDKADQDRGVSATLTFWPSEFSQLRGQVRRTRIDNGPTFNEVLLQLQFSIGAHGAHTF